MDEIVKWAGSCCMQVMEVARTPGDVIATDGAEVAHRIACAH